MSKAAQGALHVAHLAQRHRPVPQRLGRFTRQGHQPLAQLQALLIPPSRARHIAQGALHVAHLVQRHRPVPQRLGRFTRQLQQPLDERQGMHGVRLRIAPLAAQARQFGSPKLPLASLAQCLRLVTHRRGIDDQMRRQIGQHTLGQGQLAVAHGLGNGIEAEVERQAGACVVGRGPGCGVARGAGLLEAGQRAVPQRHGGQVAGRRRCALTPPWRWQRQAHGAVHGPGRHREAGRPDRPQIGRHHGHRQLGITAPDQQHRPRHRQQPGPALVQPRQQPITLRAAPRIAQIHPDAEQIGPALGLKHGVQRLFYIGYAAAFGRHGQQAPAAGAQGAVQFALQPGQAARVVAPQVEQLGRLHPQQHAAQAPQ